MCSVDLASTNVYANELRTAFLTNLLPVVEMVEITQSITACRDPKDNKFLELAMDGQATCILSSNKDLLVLHPFQGIEIVTPADFLAG
ncbi:putative toxin-antitoxin system toxin component, PIN family [Stenomitos frigidus]|uniref:Putative toxin-antitoxin system toxin component, PIN family n=1 Tax=Stenomitos frigidus ULC18 TaxID=2107698 RepID=A0A2T1ER29_9CYAN|nr:putative toxin-antitoxin system toxin component, PIN family [Stenomitos frigidus]PSB35196.1 putative toxin-antitoxin system toxin component, PIN family [Stenomitos frigidus ULC18]